jgi:hypothetical protein
MMHRGAIARDPRHGSVAELPGWFGGAPAAYVVYPDTRSGEEVSLLQLTAREEG